MLVQTFFKSYRQSFAHAHYVHAVGRPRGCVWHEQWCECSVHRLHHVCSCLKWRLLRLIQLCSHPYNFRVLLLQSEVTSQHKMQLASHHRSKEHRHFKLNGIIAVSYFDGVCVKLCWMESCFDVLPTWWGWWKGVSTFWLSGSQKESFAVTIFYLQILLVVQDLKFIGIIDCMMMHRNYFLSMCSCVDVELV